MFEKALRQLVEGGRKKKDAKPRKREPREPVASAGIAPLDSPAAEAGPGFSVSAVPIGFASPFTTPSIGPRVVGFDEREPRSRASAFDVPLDQAVADRAAPSKKSKKTESRLPDRLPAHPIARPSMLRDRKETVDELKKAVEAPELQATMGQRVAAEEAGVAAKRGDREALRQALAGLVQKLNVSSPKDAAVLLKQEAGLQAGNQVRGLLGQGKTTLDGTPGGRLFGKIGPIIRDYAPVDMKGEVDGAWGGLAEKFALGAQGKVDVVLGAAPAQGVNTGALAGGAGGPSLDGPAAPSGGAPGGASPSGGLSVFEVGSEAPASAGSAVGGASGYSGTPSPASAPLAIGEVDPKDAARIKPGEGVSPRAMANMGVSEVSPDGKVSITPTTPGISTTVNANPTSVAESADQSQRVMPQAGIAPPGSLSVGAVEMPADTPRSVTPGSAPIETTRPGALNVGVAEMPASTPQQASVRDAGRTVVAGKMTLQDVLQQNPAITEVNLQQVQPAPKGGGMLKSLGSMASSALLQKFGGGGGGGTLD
jgi:hypothetical protein